MASTSQRRRQLAREKWERQQARRAEVTRKARRRRKIGVAALTVVTIGALVTALGLWLLPNDDATTTASGDASGTEDSATTTDCTYTATGDSKGGPGLPPDKPVSASKATITLDGSPVTVALFSNAAPCTVSSFVHLADAGFFDGTNCHRLTTSDTLKVLQCGDPTGTGGGGPGYEFGLENNLEADYTAGTLAMARRGDDPNSNGSQFFLVYGDSQLPPEYTVFGHISDGLDVITEIADRGTADGSDDGEPAKPVTIDKVVAGA